MTSSGVLDSIKLPAEISPAYAYCVEGGAYFTEEDDLFPMVNVKSGAAVSYRYMDFSAKKEWNVILEGRVFKPVKAAVMLAASDGMVLCEIDMPASDDGIIYGRESFEFEGNYSDIKIVFYGEEDKELLKLYNITFE